MTRLLSRMDDMSEVFFFVAAAVPYYKIRAYFILLSKVKDNLIIFIIKRFENRVDAH